MRSKINIKNMLHPKLYIGSDHAGYELKTSVKAHLQQHQYQLEDEGAYSAERTDYPPYAHKVAVGVGSGAVGILICGSGNGVCMTANKHPDVRAALCWTVELAALARQHNDANILCIPARFVSEELAMQMVDAFLKTDFEGGRHSERVAGIPISSSNTATASRH